MAPTPKRGTEYFDESRTHDTDSSRIHGPDGEGGGEGVCMNVLEALQNDHEVTLFTLTNPDPRGLDDYFRTEVCDVRVRTLRYVESFLDWLDDPRYSLRNALLNRFVRAHREVVLLERLEELVPRDVVGFSSSPSSSGKSMRNIPPPSSVPST